MRVKTELTQGLFSPCDYRFAFFPNMIFTVIISSVSVAKKNMSYRAYWSLLLARFHISCFCLLIMLGVLELMHNSPHTFSHFVLLSFNHRTKHHSRPVLTLVHVDAETDRWAPSCGRLRHYLTSLMKGP